MSETLSRLDLQILFATDWIHSSFIQERAFWVNMTSEGQDWAGGELVWAGWAIRHPKALGATQYLQHGQRICNV